MFDLPNTILPYSPQQLLQHFQQQTRICSHYIRIASTQLYQREAYTISQTNSLLQQLEHSNHHKAKDLSEWDVFQTKQSLNSSLHLCDEGSFSFLSMPVNTRRPISRKNGPGNTNSKQFQLALKQCLDDIQRQCSNRTWNTARRLSQEYSKLKQKMHQIQKKQKKMANRQKHYQQLQHKNAVLNKKKEELQARITQLQGEREQSILSVSGAAQQLANKSQQLDLHKKIKLYEEIMAKRDSDRALHLYAECPQSQLSNEWNVMWHYLQTRQQLISLRNRQLQAIQGRVQAVLWESQLKCQSCCSALQRMKGSILKYKRYLEKEGEGLDALVDGIKNIIKTARKSE